MGNNYITYDSPWERIRTQASIANWARFPQDTPSEMVRPPLTRDEVELLTGIPVALVDENYVPPHPCQLQMEEDTPTYKLQLAARVACLRFMVKEAGLPAERFDFQDMAEMLRARCHFVYGPADTARHAHGATPETLDGPLHLRLHGPQAPCMGVIITSSYYDGTPRRLPHTERHLAIPAADNLQICQLHEVFHLVQRCPEQVNMLYVAQRERDAENASLTSYQSVYKGSPALAAGCIVEHVAALPFMRPEKQFWPGLPADRLHEGPRLVETFRQITSAYMPQHDWQPSQYADVLTFLSETEPCWDSIYPAEIQPLTQRLLDAGRFVYPQLLDFDPVKPRISLARQNFANRPAAA